ncbi:MAG: methylated-DNA--[protein]-cysteine S-methyltransferase [Planctomycetota bacterium]
MATDRKRFVVFKTALGPAGVVGGKKGIKRVLLPGAKRPTLVRTIREEFPDAEEDGRGLAGAAKSITRYFETGRLTGRAPRLDLEGVTGLRRDVYDALGEIPPGETVTYAELAARIGHPGAHRSVGTALSRNPVPLLVPCHRVLRSDGGLGGFTAEGGVDLKRRMLELEGTLPV